VGVVVRCLTFEVSWRQRQGARPEPQKMYTVPVARAWWPAVGAQLDRGVRPRRAMLANLAEPTETRKVLGKNGFVDELAACAVVRIPRSRVLCLR
jgi:hypothetical protein